MFVKRNVSFLQQYFVILESRQKNYKIDNREIKKYVTTETNAPLICKVCHSTQSVERIDKLLEIEMLCFSDYVLLQCGQNVSRNWYLLETFCNKVPHCCFSEDGGLNLNSVFTDMNTRNIQTKM